MSFKKKIIVLSLLLNLIFISSIQVINSRESKDNQENKVIDQPVIFIHGWTKTSADFDYIKSRLIEDGWNSSNLFAYTFADSIDCSVSGIKNDAGFIRNWVNKILTQTGNTKVDIIAHSMGGISARYYIKFLGGNITVDDYVSLGTDQHGTPNDNICYKPTNSLIKELNGGDETPYGLLNNDTIGSRQDVYGISYSGTHIPGDINYTSIFSKNDDIVPYLSTNLMGAYHIEQSNSANGDPILHSDLYQDPGIYQLVKNAIMDPQDYPTSQSSSSANQTGLGVDSFAVFLSLVALAIFKIKHKKKH